MANTHLWFTELQNEDLTIGLRIKKILHSEQTEYQTMDVVETVQYGNMLVLDGCIMTTDKDEFVYHEMLAHVPMHTHPNPKKVLVVGGGDGGIIREAIKHPSVEKAVLAEIDGRVIEISKQYFPHIASGLSDPRVEVHVADGILHVQNHPNEYDVILVDSTDPIGPAVGLFAKEFYQAVFNALKEDGVFAAQTESPFINQDLIARVYRDVQDTFPIAKLYWGTVPTYPTGMWSFTLGSKKHDPLAVNTCRVADTKYYTPEIHHASFVLPKFLQELLRK
ncbi:polyamine aminopropyltransferase [Alicyclobacillus cycloheptanicus]|uniref:Polyamine aminopropyltransferase n=1 Tax=Alicyclobacillus cycloheptanicus TaxID=1457 RepID=A0ABT9XMK8_9BACL|nr:polyamine aminopropyltransferase [Alicyclobacillus cycloheptanicus]MDQ0191558.1 spermidine synthase [Alicyclobacillus cycloheptanicus]WDM02346.1 polyamine aminopropyltransferase [Alicyclobacillus cycloheptanicus]